MKLAGFALLLCCLLWSGISSNAFTQTLSESFGAQQTSFRITSDTLDLTPLTQQVVKRGQANWGLGNSEAAYGYGYESLHLEFQTAKRILTQDRFNQPYRKRWFLEVELLDPRGEQLARLELNTKNLREVWNEEQTRYTYLLDLKNIPLLLLDQTERINLLRLNFYKRSQP